MSQNPDVDFVLFRAIDLLEEERVPFLVLGAIAVNVWGIPRYTIDVDFEIQLDREALPKLLAAAERAGFMIPEHAVAGFTDSVGGVMPLVPLKWWVERHAIAVDLFLAETPFLREVFRRRVTVDLGEDRRCAIASAADLILFKLLAWRDKDRMDIKNILAIQGVPDEPYLREWAARLGIGDRLGTVLREPPK